MPELRFPEFSDNWETVALSDFTERVTRKNVNNESNLPLTISSKDGLVDQISYFNKAVASRNMSGYYLLQNGEFAYNKSYSVGYDFGSIKRLDKYPKGALSTLYICFALKKYDSDFIKIYFDSLKWYREIRMIAAEGARNHGLLNVSADAFFATKHILPQNEKEQEKIAAFMVLLGKKVVLQQQLVDALKLYKRGALSRLFPKNGASVPEYRFSGFTGDWEQRKLGEMFRERTERANGDEELLSVTIGNGVIRQADSDKRNIASEDKSNYKIVHVGDVPYNSMRMWQGAVGNSEYNGIVSPAYTVLVPEAETNGKFFMELFKKESSLKIFQRWSQGLTSDTWNLKYPVLSTIEFFIPTIEEQNQIALFFERIDHLITLHQHKLDIYKSIKQGLLGSMITTQMNADGQKRNEPYEYRPSLM